MIVFEIIGVVTCGVIAYFIIFAVFKAIEEGISSWNRRIRHRFDKPPTAKCYCVDCKYYRKDGYCNDHSGWGVADSWFCWDATPKDGDSDV